jgi:hypothetical protein
MAGIQDFERYTDDFVGASVTFPTSANIGTPWITAVTGAAPPTHVRAGGLATLSLTSASQAQILSLHHGDALGFDIDDIISMEMKVELSAATFTSGSILVFGLGSARNDTADSVAANAWFRMEGANSTTQVYVETDDGTRDIDDIATGQTLGTVFKRFVIDFSGGKRDVKFYIDGNRVAANRTFDMSAYSAGLQPMIQLQKASNTNADVAIIDYVEIVSKRRAP